MDIYADLTDEDLVAVISYLRSVPAAKGIPSTADINILGKLTLAYFLKPYAPAGTPKARLVPEASVAYGDYVANTLAGCRSCHTARNLKTGEYLSPFFSGGLAFRARQHPGFMYVSPNLTPDKDTGVSGWTEDAFAKVQARASDRGFADALGQLRITTDTDLRAFQISAQPAARSATMGQRCRRNTECRRLDVLLVSLAMRGDGGGARAGARPPVPILPPGRG